MIWFLEGQSSQRDVILAARQALQGRATILGSHRKHRPDITSVADIELQEPKAATARLAWILENAREHDVKLVHAGRDGASYERHRQAFLDAGLTLVTGALSLKNLQAMDNKGRFTRTCQSAGLAVPDTLEVHNVDELAAAVDELGNQFPVCVKPVVGIFGQGFWLLKKDADPFACFADPDLRVVETRRFIDAYADSQKQGPLLVMRYLPGEEHSVDIVCEAGVVIAAVARCKINGFQHLSREGDVIDLARQAAALFGCDGIINIQTRRDEDGKPFLLEINPRPSGGIGYTLAGGINLPGIFVTRRLGFDLPPDTWCGDITVRPVSIGVPV